MRVQVGRLARLAEEQGIRVELDDSALDQLAEEGFDPEYGARPLKRALQKRVQNQLADAILAGDLKSGDLAWIDYTDGEFRLTVKHGEQAEPAHQPEPAGV